MNKLKDFLGGFNLDAILGWLVLALGVTACTISAVHQNIVGGSLSVVGLLFGAHLTYKAGPIHHSFDQVMPGGDGETAALAETSREMGMEDGIDTNRWS